MEKEMRKTTVGNRNAQRTYNYVKVPQLRIEGLWLEKAGFHSGAMVEVEVRKGMLVLKAKN